MLTKKDYRNFIVNIFLKKNCDFSFIQIDYYEVKISIFERYERDRLQKLLLILKTIEETPYIDSSWSTWRKEGYYNDTMDITMNFKIDKEKVRKTLKNK